MDIETNTISTSPLETIPDASGTAEMQAAFEEIEKLKKQTPPEEAATEFPEEAKEEENAESAPEEEEKLPVKKEKKDEKAWKIKKDKYKILAQKEALEHENAELRELLDQSLNSGTYHYARSIYTDLEKAKEKKRKAIDEGDGEAFLEADIEATKALIAANDLEKWQKSESLPKASVDIPNNNEISSDFSETQMEILHDWLIF